MNFNKSSGQISKILIISAMIILVVMIVIFGVVKFINTKKKSDSKKSENSTTIIKEAPKPIYETTLSDIKFLLKSSEDLGNILNIDLSYGEDLTTTEKFIKVVVGAQNKGKNNIPQYTWDLGNIIDSDGRNFVSINDKAYYLLPKPDLCGALLKPEFNPVPCVKYYEVSKKSKGLKVMVMVVEPKKQESLIDLNLNQ